MATDKQDRHEPGPDKTRRSQPDGDVIVTKISGKDMDLTIKRMSLATAPYFRPGGPLMPKEPQSS